MIYQKISTKVTSLISRMAVRLSICRSCRVDLAPQSLAQTLEPSNLTTLSSTLRCALKPNSQHPAWDQPVSLPRCVQNPLFRRASHTSPLLRDQEWRLGPRPKRTQSWQTNPHTDNPHPSRNCIINLHPSLMRHNPLLPPLPPALLAISPTTYYIRTYTIPTRPHSR